MKQIIVNKSYLDDIKEIIQSINSFFSSGYQAKNFPLETIDLNPLRATLYWLNEVDPLLVKEPERLDDLITQVTEYYENCERYDQIDDTFDQMCRPIIAMRLLEFYTDNFKEFNRIINGVYDLSLFIKPSEYQTELDVLDKHISINDIVPLLDGTPEEAAEKGVSLPSVHVFDIQSFVHILYEDDRIQFPKELQDKEKQLDRILNKEDLEDVEVVVDESIQESAEVSSIEPIVDTMSKKMNHIRYEKGKFHISNELKRNIDFLIHELKKCDTSEDLMELFKTPTKDGFPKLSPDDFIPFIPAILLRVFTNNRKYPFDMHDSDICSQIKTIHTIKMGQNKGAKRFGRFDLFSCFKMDKEGTIKFLEDFLKLNLVNNRKKITINNNTLLTVFNIFDSNLYLRLLYEKIPNADRKDEWGSLYEFIKSTRTIINKNSRNANVYKTKEPTLYSKQDDEDVEEHIESIEEFSTKCLECLGEMSTSDMQLCDIFEYIVESEINTYENTAYNMGWGNLKTEAYIAESFLVMDEVNDYIILEQETGDLPDYIKKRMGLSDDTSSGDRSLPTITPPQNPIDDLADSINTKLGMEGELQDQLGKGFKDNPTKSDGKIVNNITNINIRDSHIGNKTSNDYDLSSRTKNDLSTGKTTTISNTNSNNTSTDNSRKEKKDRSSHTKNDLSSVMKNSNNTKNMNPSNINNNSRKSEESKDFNEMDLSFLISNPKLTMEQVIAILESDEPPSTGTSAGKKPRQDLLTTAMDMDKNTLSTQQSAKRKLQKGINTTRAIIRPITRTKSWLTKIVNSLIKRDEDKVKAEIIENPSYRTALFKACRLALKFGMFGICYTITPYIGAAYIVIQGAKAVDKSRLKKEIQEEFAAEINILNDKIERASRDDTPASRQAVWKMKRLKSKMERMVVSKGVHDRSFKPNA